MFKELVLPAEEDKGVYTGCWFVFAAGHAHCLLADGSNELEFVRPVGNVDVGRYMFGSKDEAHAAAAAYYRDHGKSYPYVAEWGIPQNNTAPVAEPQVMEF